MRIAMLCGGILAAAALIFGASLLTWSRTLDTAGANAGTSSTASAMDMTGTGDSMIKGQSFAGAAPENAAALAKAHTPYPAALPPLTPGDVVKVHMVLKDVTIEIAPGIKYAAWGFEGGAPGPVVHARQGYRTPRS